MSEERQESEAQSPSPEPIPSGPRAETEADSPPPSRQPVWRRLVVAFALLAALAGAGYFGVWTLMPVSTDDKVVIVEIPESGARRIAELATEAIQNQTAFLLAGRLLGLHTPAGVRLSPSMTPVEFWISWRVATSRLLGDGAGGVTIREIAAIFHEMQLIDPPRFITLASRGGIRSAPVWRTRKTQVPGHLRCHGLSPSSGSFGSWCVINSRSAWPGARDRGADQRPGLEETIVLAPVGQRRGWQRAGADRGRLGEPAAERDAPGVRRHGICLGKTKRPALLGSQVNSPYNTYRISGCRADLQSGLGQHPRGAEAGKARLSLLCGGWHDGPTHLHAYFRGAQGGHPQGAGWVNQ